MANNKNTVMYEKKNIDNYSKDLFEYWLPRLTADGVDTNDVLRVHRQVSGWNDWPCAWAEMGDNYISLAKSRKADGYHFSTGEALLRASLAYHCGQIVAFNTPELKAELQQRKVSAFREAAPLLLPPAERLEIAFKNLKIPGFLRLPKEANTPVPCVLLVPGLDSTKEDFNTISEMCIQRGLASFAFDGPGQGEVHKDAFLEEGYENCILAVFESVSQRPEIDSKRIGTLGRSLGGYYVMRAAASNKEIAATVVFGGTYDLSDFPNMPFLIRDGFRHATGAKSEKEALSLMGKATLDDCITTIKTPTLVVHGKRDQIFNWKQAKRIVDSLTGQATLALDEDGVHCCHNHAFQYRTYMIDWLSKVL
ncbi:MAG: alpha/beta hydrolase [Alphaproteobacteria bacterium]|jgi:2,6-dihydroxypseudooxynicotine hydrolase|nr:alpha/beta hydrolase [Alphaproteobacteria bacterium]